MWCVVSGPNLNCFCHHSGCPGLNRKLDLSEDSPPPGTPSLHIFFQSSWHCLVTRPFPFSCGHSSYLQSVFLHLAEESLPLNEVLGFLRVQRTFARSPAALPPSFSLHLSFHYRNRVLGRRLASLRPWSLFAERGDRVRKPRGHLVWRFHEKGSSGLAWTVVLCDRRIPQSFCFWPRLPTSSWDVDEFVPGSSLTITSVFTLCCFGVTAVSWMLIQGE